MAMGENLDRVPCRSSDIDEQLGHPVCIWLNAPTHEKVAIG